MGISLLLLVYSGQMLYGDSTDSSRSVEDAKTCCVEYPLSEEGFHCVQGFSCLFLIAVTEPTLF